MLTISAHHSVFLNVRGIQRALISDPRTVIILFFIFYSISSSSFKCLFQFWSQTLQILMPITHIHQLSQLCITSVLQFKKVFPSSARESTWEPFSSQSSVMDLAASITGQCFVWSVPTTCFCLPACEKTHECTTDGNFLKESE